MNFQQISNTTEATIQSLHPFSTYIIAVAAETVDVGPFTDNTVVRLPEDGMWNCFTVPVYLVPCPEIPHLFHHRHLSKYTKQLSHSTYTSIN